MENEEQSPEPNKGAIDEATKFQFEREKFEFDRHKYQVETLKTLHDAGLARWKDRRENEWKLNYAIWAGIAAFDGVLLASKSPMGLPLRRAIWLVVIGVVFHGAYLLPTILRAISEIELQKETEIAIRDSIQDVSVRRMIKREHLGGAIDRYEKRSWLLDYLWKGYGLIAPLALTAGLLCLAVYLMTRSGPQPT